MEAGPRRARDGQLDRSAAFRFLGSYGNGKVNPIRGWIGGRRSGSVRGRRLGIRLRSLSERIILGGRRPRKQSAPYPREQESQEPNPARTWPKIIYRHSKHPSSHSSELHFGAAPRLARQGWTPISFSSR